VEVYGVRNCINVTLFTSILETFYVKQIDKMAISADDSF
jgi:hypothetical protein